MSALPDFEARRVAMVRDHLVGRGVRDARVIEAFSEVPREAFVPSADQRRAYDDRALPIGYDQTISQPYVVALMLEALALRPTDRMLEIGSGSGYVVALAGRLCARVVGVERVAPLVARSAQVLADLGCENVAVVESDGSVGWSDEAPYDAILVSAAAPSVPEALREQLADGGRLVIPTSRSRWSQDLLRIERVDGRFEETNLGGVAFVPLIGAAGWADD